MKKRVIAAGAASAALAAMPMVGVFANQTDTLVVQIQGVCTVDLNSVPADPGPADTGHVDGSATWSGQTLTGQMSNGSSTQNFGQTKLKVTCNDNDGFDVSATMNDLTAAAAEDGEGNKITIAPTASFGDGTSGYALKVSNATTGLTPASNGWIGTTGNIVSASQPISGGSFIVTYGVGVSATQAADNYTGTVVYGITAKQ